MQPRLFDPPSTLPEGFRYQPDLLTLGEEAALLAWFADLPFQPFQLGQYEGLRRVVYFGQRYDYTERVLQAAPPMPAPLTGLREKAAAFAAIPADRFQQAMVTEYRPGAPIGWHRDRPNFAEVVGISLLSPCAFRFRRRRGEGWERASLTAEPRSVYILSGPSRTEWEHSIPAVKAQRYSVTFRRLRES